MSGETHTSSVVDAGIIAQFIKCNTEKKLHLYFNGAEKKHRWDDGS